MNDTAFEVRDLDRLAVPYCDGPPGLRRMSDPDVLINPQGERTNFSPGRIFNPRAFQSGGAGMVGTADDLMTFFEAIRIGGGDVLRPETVEMARAEPDRRPAPAAAGRRPALRLPLRAIVDDPEAADSPVARGTLRWGGVYGHEWSVDPASGITDSLDDQHALRGLQRPVPLRYPRCGLRQGGGSVGSPTKGESPHAHRHLEHQRGQGPAGTSSQVA